LVFVKHLTIESENGSDPIKLYRAPPYNSLSMHVYTHPHTQIFVCLYELCIPKTEVLELYLFICC